MIRLGILLLYGLGVLFLNRFVGENVTSIIDVPSNVEAGKMFTVDVTIDKGMLSGFSRFQQKLPAGLKVTPVESESGDFRFEEKTVKLLWFNLPQKEQLKLSYQVEVDQRLKGEFVIDGDFSYIENNERKSVRIRSHSIEIEPSDQIDPRLIVHVDDFERMITPDLSQRKAAAFRQNPQREETGGFLVNLLISKQDRGKFAKIEEAVPDGFIAEPVDTRGGIFTSRGNTVKFLWMSLPEDENFVVSYRLMPKPERQTTREDISVQGTFSFIEGRETVSVNIQQRDVDLTSLSAMQIKELLDEEKDSGIGVLPHKGKVTAELDEEEDTKELSDAVVAEKTIDKEEDELPVNDFSRFSADEDDKVSYILEPETGIYYRVQLAAGHRPVNIDGYFRKYNLNHQVKRETHEGWYKYSVGSFKVYREARDYRVQVWNTTTIDDAFVAAYNSGHRITVQEALMISNQKWYH